MPASEHYPRGTVAFLFTDIEGSTRLWQHHRPAMERAHARHDAILRGAVADQHGVVYKVVGDALQAAFRTAPDAVAATVEAQLGLEFEDWTALGLPAPLRVRMALHAGDVDPGSDGDYRSPVLNRLGRLLGAGHGGQVLLSQTVVQLARDRLPEEVTLHDLGDHRLKDLLQSEHVHQLLHPALAADFPPLVTLERRPHNLPVQLTPVIGREREVREVVALLTRPEVRLVTLTGPGGTGKTRLSLQVAAELVEGYPDGVWFVPLAAIADPALVPAAIAEALELRETGETPLSDLLRDSLRERRLLLVLDNFEQVLDAAPAVQQLLAAPQVTILVTSRASLRLRGEREYPVSPLGLPKRKPPPTAEQLSQYAAVQLFIERGQGVRPDFAVTNENAPAIAEICHLLDGLPLAIELAAARVKMLPPQAMLARLEQRLPMLTGGARDLPARQQTLRAAIAWSYDLQEVDEQKLYRRLSVFAGSFSLEAAEAVAGSPGSGELGLDVFEGLGRLVDHSLVRQQEGLEGEPRFVMLETIREFGLERLEAAGEAGEARQRHAAYVLSAIVAVQPMLVAGVEAATQRAGLDRLEADHDNLRLALTWALDSEPETALRMGAVGWKYWAIRGYFSEGRGYLERALARAEGAPADRAEGAPADRAEGAPADRAAALDGAAALAWMGGDFAAADVRGEAALALYESLGDEVGIGGALSMLGNIAGDSGRSEQARVRYEQALSVCRRLGDRPRIATVLNNLGVELIAKVEFEAARPLLEEALGIAREFGDVSMQSTVHGNLGEMAEALGDAATALAENRAALRLSWEVRDVYFVVLSLDALAVAVRHASPVQATRLLGAAESAREKMGMTIPTSSQSMHDRGVAETRAALGGEAFAAAWAAGRALSLDEAVAEALALADRIPGAGG